MLFHEVHDATDNKLLYGIVITEEASITMHVKSAGTGVVRLVSQIQRRVEYVPPAHLIHVAIQCHRMTYDLKAVVEAFCQLCQGLNVIEVLVSANADGTILCTFVFGLALHDDAAKVVHGDVSRRILGSVAHGLVIGF